MDEIIGLTPPMSTNFKIIQPDKAANNLREYIKEKLVKDQIKPRMLARQAGLSVNSIAEFIKEPLQKIY